MTTYYVITWDMQGIEKVEAESFSEVDKQFPDALYIATKQTMQTLKDQLAHFDKLN